MNLSTTIAVIGYFIGVAGAITILFSRVKTENLKDLSQRVEILEGELKRRAEENLDNQKDIASLQGKLDAYREIPLKFIPEALQQLIKSNNLILASMEKSAVALSAEKGNGGLLVKTKVTKPLDVKEAT